MRIDEWFLILLWHQTNIVNEQKKDYNRLWHQVDFCVTKLEKLGDANYESESESEECNEEQGESEEGKDEEKGDKKDEKSEKE